MKRSEGGGGGGAEACVRSLSFPPPTVVDELLSRQGAQITIDSGLQSDKSLLVFV